MKSLRIWLAPMVLALSVVAMAGTAQPKVGDIAPDFSLVGSDGRTYRLSEFRGKQAVVLAWFAKAFTAG
jgi:thioredoxin-dependent peroxiredoxin